MRIKSIRLIMIIIGLLFFQPSASGFIDAPHNECNNINCGSCHGKALLNSPFWGGSGSYDQICLSCHKALSGPYTDTNAPLAQTHSSQNTGNRGGYPEWSIECRTCHDPHYQRQKIYKNENASDLYLASGTIVGYIYNAGNNESILTYSDITYKPGWNADKLTEKTSGYRRTILYPNVGRLGYSYPIISVDEISKTITVKGDVSPVYEYISTSSFAAIYGQYIKENIEIDGTNKKIKFLDKEGESSFADGDSTFDGICEICHSQTIHYRYNGQADEQVHENISGERAGGGKNCSRCHKHVEGLGHGKGKTCDNCHGHDDSWSGGPYYGSIISHSTHTENDGNDRKGPYYTCSDCHNTAKYPDFISGNDNNGDGKFFFAETDVCDTCHSPGGSFNGLISQGASIGAKAYWLEGVYQSDDTLPPGKEKWCAGCHDDVPAVVDGNTAPDIVGDNSTYGFYLNAHGNNSYGVERTGSSYSQGECVHCHDVSIGSTHGGQLYGGGSNDKDFCLQCHKGNGSVQVGGVTNYMYSKTFGGESGSHGITSVYDAFNASGSTHDLASILSYAKSKGWVPSGDNNACLVCHIDVHKLRPNKRHPQDPTYTVLRLPSEYSTNPDNLWGDDTNEQLNDNWSPYRAPYFSSTSSREPGGTSSTNGSKHPDYNTFCLDCHSESIYGRPSIARWSVSDCAYPYFYHGKNYTCPAPGGTKLKSPYPDNTALVLSCLDCHEPHGSTNLYLLRTEANKTSNLTWSNNSDTTWRNWCIACHEDVGTHWSGWDTCAGCHAHGQKRSI